MASNTTATPRIEVLDPDGVPDRGADVRDLLKRVPRGEYLFLKEDLKDPSVIDTWTRQGAHIYVAYLHDELAGLLALLPGIGWSSHVGEIRMVVDPAKRGQGVGAALARQGLVAAVTAGLDKVSVEVLAEQDAVSRLFADLGFTPEALLADHVRDDEGVLHDLLVLSHPIEQTWSGLATLGMAHTGGQA